jgi:MFS transporter, AAHS family, vanillate permease
MGKGPKAIIDGERMRIGQWAAVFITVVLNALDGFDVLSISFASPGIAKEWGIDRAALGWVLSTELFGMGVGSLVLGGVADKIGRRPMILGCLVAMSVGMWGAGHSSNISMLLAFRLFTGLGIGGMLAAINAVAAEFSNQRWRALAVALMVIGYPLGGVFGGLIVQKLLVAGGWRDIFVFGAWATMALVPIVWFFVPESVAYLARLRSSDALQRVNAALLRLGHQAVSQLPGDGASQAKQSVIDILRPGLLSTTMLVTVAYFAHIITFYFVLKWIPKIVVDMGFAPAAAAGVLTWANLGGATGGALFGALATRAGLRALTIIALIGSSAAVAWFGRGAPTLSALSILVCVTGFFTNSGVVGIYSLFAKVFPTHVRATGTGFAIGIGRGGAALAPVVAGYLFGAGFSLQTVALFMAAGSLISAGTLLALKANEAD